jgi:hypothetical protein
LPNLRTEIEKSSSALSLSGNIKTITSIRDKKVYVNDVLIAHYQVTEVTVRKIGTDTIEVKTTIKRLFSIKDKDNEIIMDTGSQRQDMDHSSSDGCSDGRPDR